MIIRTARSVIFLLAISCPVSVCEPNSFRIRTGGEWLVKLDNADVSFDVPPPVTRKELRDYGLILALSEAQAQYVDQVLFENYQRECDEVGGERVDELLALAQTVVNARRSAAPRPVVVKAMLELRSIEDTLCAMLEKADDLFFSQISGILSESQLPHLERVKLHRQRMSSLRELFDLRKARIDLSNAVQLATVPEDARRELDPTMRQYELEATPLVLDAARKLRISKAFITRRTLDADFDDEGKPLDLSNPIHSQRSADAWQSIEDSRRERATAQLRICEVNDKYLPLFAAHLPDTLARTFRLSYLSASYHYVYPDPTDCEPLYRRLMEVKELTANLATTIEAEWTQYRRKYESLCQEMCAETDRWQRQGAFEGNSRGFQEHNDLMDSWRLQRAAMSEAFVKHVQLMLPSQVMSSQSQTFERWQSILKRYCDSITARQPRRYVDFS